MGYKKVIVIWTLTLISLCIGLAGILTGIAGHAWWVVNNDLSDIKEGLWKTCNEIKSFGTDACTSRDNILEFKHFDQDINTQIKLRNKEQDAILVVLITAAVSAFLGIVSEVLMMCIQKSEDTWKCGALLTTLFSFCAAMSGLAGLVYAEIEFNDKWETYDHGWSVIRCWVGDCFLIISLILCFILLCTKGQLPHRLRGTSYSTQTSGYKRTGMASGGERENKAYELK